MSGLTFTSLIHFEFSIMCKVRQLLNSIKIFNLLAERVAKCDPNEMDVTPKVVTGKGKVVRDG